MLLEPAGGGTVPTAFPANMKLRMVAPADLGKSAVERLTSPVGEVLIVYVEGPDRYSFNDFAAAPANKLGRPVEVATTPRAKWVDSFKAVGFSPEAATAYAKMTGVTIEARDLPRDPRRGKMTLADYVAGLEASGQRRYDGRPGTVGNRVI